jgi:hypothetical protein
MQQMMQSAQPTGGTVQSRAGVRHSKLENIATLFSQDCNITLPTIVNSINEMHQRELAASSSAALGSNSSSPTKH